MSGSPRPRACRRGGWSWVHAFPNALIPVITVMGIAFGLLMASRGGGRDVFAIKGLGRILIEGILNRDYPVVQGAILVVSFIFVFVNLGGRCALRRHRPKRIRVDLMSATDHIATLYIAITED